MTEDGSRTDGSIFVSPTGNGDGSSPSSALGSITEALKQARPGDVVVLAGGRYDQDVRVSRPARASAAQPIRVVAASGSRPVIAGLVRLKGLIHWSIEGIDVTWPTSGATSSDHLVKLTDGDRWSWSGSEIWGARSFAAVLVAGSPSNWTLSDLHVHDTAATNAANQDHLIYVNANGGPGVIERSLLEGSPNGRAIKVGPPSLDSPPVGNVTIRYNTMVDNGGPSNVQLSAGTSNVTVHHNLMVRPGPGSSAVTAYRLTGSGNVVRDNVAWQAEGVVEDDPGLTDGGGNSMANPDFVPGTRRPSDPAGLGVGHLAP